MIQYPHNSIFGEESLILSNSEYQVEICADKVNIFRRDVSSGKQRVWSFDKQDSIEIAQNILQKLAPDLLADHAKPDESSDENQGDS